MLKKISKERDVFFKKMYSLLIEGKIDIGSLPQFPEQRYKQANQDIANQIAQLLIEAYQGVNQASLAKAKGIISSIQDIGTMETAIGYGTVLAMQQLGIDRLNEGQQSIIQMLYGAFNESNKAKEVVNNQQQVQNPDVINTGPVPEAPQPPQENIAK
jgi:hypothetical protein